MEAAAVDGAGGGGEEESEKSAAECRWRSPLVGRRSSSWGGDECLSLVPQVGCRHRCPKRPNQHWDSVVVAVVDHVASLAVVAVEEVWKKRSLEMLLACVVLVLLARLVVCHKKK